MVFPSEPVNLSVEQLKELNKKLSAMRHDINNSLSVMVALTDLLRRQPDSTGTMLEKLAEQPKRINESIIKFSLEFEGAFGIRRM